MFRINKFFVASTFGALVCASTFAQSSISSGNQDITNKLAGQSNVITTAVPFLTIAPDSRAGGMGETGVATQTDVYSMHWNPSKYAFGEKDLSIGISYTPWLRNLGISDINLAYLAGYKKLDKVQTVAATLRYFSLGTILFKETATDPGYEYSPSEFAVDAAYARLLSESFSMSIAGRFIYTDLLGNYSEDAQAGIAGAADISGYYKKNIKIQEYPALLTAGFNFSNIGSKISYTDGGEKNFIPTNMRIGAGLKTDIDNYNQLAVYTDISKLLVPTPTKTIKDEETGEEIIIGRDNEVSPVQGIFQSFNDAPGGFDEELHEFQISIGAEYWYAKQFGLRTGYFHEHETKGNRKFFTLGVGLKLNVFSLDFAYLVPTAGKNSPLANTLRFSLTFDFEGLKEEQTPTN